MKEAQARKFEARTLVKRERGFDGRTFLTQAEWQTYCRRVPVRRTDKQKDGHCHLCGEPATDGNPLQNAHVIGFIRGVIDLGLTPEFLDSHTNLVTAHRARCNKATELDLRRSMAILRVLGITELPSFLPDSIHAVWVETARDDRWGDAEQFRGTIFRPGFRPA
jgi:hypothetical protein